MPSSSIPLGLVGRNAQANFNDGIVSGWRRRRRPNGRGESTEARAADGFRNPPLSGKAQRGHRPLARAYFPFDFSNAMNSRIAGEVDRVRFWMRPSGRTMSAPLISIATSAPSRGPAPRSARP